MPPKTTSALIGALAAAGLATIISYFTMSGGAFANPGLGCIVCLAYIAGSLIAVWHYTNEHNLTLSGSQGVGLGLLTGVYAGVIAALLSYLLIAIGVMPGMEEMLEQMEESGLLDQPGAEFSRRMMEMMSGPVGLVISLVQNAIVGGIVGLAGGAIGRAIWKKGEEEDNLLQS